MKLALLLKNTELPAWQYELIRRVREVPHIDITLILLEDLNQPTVADTLLSLLLDISGRVEKKISGWEGDARRLKSSLPLLAQIPVLDSSAIQARQIFMDNKIDLLLDVQGNGQIRDYYFNTPTQQVWRYFYDRNTVLAADQAGVRDYAGGNSRLVSGLLSLGADKKQKTLFWASSGTDRPLPTQNIDQMLWKMADFVPFLLRHCDSLAALQQQVQQRHRHYTMQSAMADINSNEPALTAQGVTVRDIGRVCRRLVSQAGDKLAEKISGRLRLAATREQWVLLLGKREALQSPRHIHNLTQFRQIVPPQDRFWADPFLAHEAGRDYLFFEELVYHQGKGRLACMELQADGSYDKPLVVLEQPFHLSYPFIFRYRNAWYMVPESAESHSLDLYRCQNFPQHWVRVKTIMADVEAYDATLYEDEGGRWWMFVCMRQHEYASTNELLYLFSASSPLSDDWEPHPCNPVVTDAATARPAGHLLKLNGRLYRPSQNCAKSYGKGLNLNEVITLNRQVYQEQTSSRLLTTGQEGLGGVHTMNCLNGWVVSDGIRLHK